MNSWKAEEKPYVFKQNVFFFSFFPQEITELKEYYTRFSFANVDDQPVAFAAVIHLMSEKRDWGTTLSNLLLMAIYVQARRSLHDPTICWENFIKDQSTPLLFISLLLLLTFSFDKVLILLTKTKFRLITFGTLRPIWVKLKLISLRKEGISTSHSQSSTIYYISACDNDAFLL